MEACLWEYAATFAPRVISDRRWVERGDVAALRCIASGTHCVLRMVKCMPYGAAVRR